MLTPKFERATKTDEHYTGTINGRTYVVPHSFDDHGSTKAMRHAIVVALAHVTHNNPGLKPEEHARIHQHIKDIHGGQDAAKLNEERQLALHLGMTKSDKVTPEAPAAKKPARPVSTKSPEEKGAERAKYRNAALAKRAAALYDSRREATLAFARRKGIIKERTITFGSMKFNKIANTKPITYNSFGKIVKEESMSPENPEQIDELNQNTLKSYTRKAYGNIGFQSGMIAHLKTRKYKSPDLQKSTADQLKVHTRKEKNRGEGLDRALGKLGESSTTDADDQAEKQWEKDEEARSALKQTAGKKRRSLFNQLYRSQTAGRPGFSTMEESSAEHINYTLAKAEHPKEYAADKKAKEDAAKKKVRMNWHKHGGKLFREAHLEESFMSTYKRNENANRHTENVVHLAKHFGTKADQAKAKFFKDELTKHGHNIHHEDSYTLHEKLWPHAVAAHDHANQLEESHLPSGTKVRFPHKGHMKTGTVVRHQPGSLYTGSPAYVVYHGETESAVVPHHKVERLKESYQVGDKVHLGFGQKGGAGYDGTVHKIEGDQVHVKIGTGAVFKGDRIVVGPRKHVTMKEEAEQLDELKSTTLKKYIKGASQSLVTHAHISARAREHERNERAAGHPIAQDHFKKAAEKYEKKTNRRMVGVQRASAQLEEAEQIDEISQKLALSAANKRLEIGQAWRIAQSKVNPHVDAAGKRLYNSLGKRADDAHAKAQKSYEYAHRKGMAKGEKLDKELEEEHSSTFNTVRRVLRGE